MSTLGVTKEEVQFGNDWPSHLEKGEKVVGVITELAEYGVDTIDSSKNPGRTQLKINLVFKIVGGPLHGFGVRDAIWIPCDAKGWFGSEGAKKYLGSVIAALGIDLAEWEVPTSIEEAIQAVEGRGKWIDQAMTGRLVQMTCGEPNSYTVKSGEKKGEVRGPYTTFGFWSEVDDNTRELLGEDLTRLMTSQADKQAEEPEPEPELDAEPDPVDDLGY